MSVVLALLLAFDWSSLWRETNSHAASKRGASQYAGEKYEAAVESYRRAQQLAPTARNAFNLGTAQIAAGTREEGSATLANAVKDPALRADALYNRGNSALGSNAFDHAIEDYKNALRVDPNHAAAKRNLEIALRRRNQSQRSGGGGDRQQQQQQGGDKQQQPQPAPGNQPQKPAPQQGQADAEALLRSVQQQEQEELTRMQARRHTTRVGW
jgi:Ca-activated chloride channel family protein